MLMPALMKKILVIDDDRDLLDVITMVLQIKGFQVSAHTHPNHIYETIAAFKPDLILLDIQLSGADGRLVCKHIKESAGFAHIPVILFSANQSYKQDVQTYLADDFIEKPFELSNFLNKINHFAAQEQL